MKIKNKKTGEIGWLYCDHISVPKKMTVFSEDKDLSAKHWDYESLAELNSEWEDYEEPKVYWYIDDAGVLQIDQVLSSEINMRKSIGNYFETKEEAEKAVEKLKAWKRLNEYGVKFNLDFVKNNIYFTYRLSGCLCSTVDYEKEIFENLYLLFGGEE